MQNTSNNNYTIADSRTSTKDSIVNTAKRSFASKGINSTSLRDICREIGISVSAIHYYFENKNDLTVYIFRQIVNNQLDLTSKTLKKIPKDIEEFKNSLTLYINSMLNSFLNDLDGFTIMEREIININSDIKDLHDKVIMEIIRTVVNFLEESKKNDIICQKIDSLIVSHMIYANVSLEIRAINCKSSPVFYEKEYKELKPPAITDDTYRKKWVENVVSIIVNGLTKKPSINRQ